MDLHPTKDGLKFASARVGHQYVQEDLEVERGELYVDNLDISNMVLMILYACMQFTLPLIVQGATYYYPRSGSGLIYGFDCL